MELHQLGTLDALLHEAAMFGGGHRVAAAADDQGRGTHDTLLLAVVGVTHGGAVGGVALGGGLRQHADDGLELGRLGLGEAQGEPAGDGRIAQVTHGLGAAGERGVDARVPDFRSADLGGGVAQHQTLDALRGVDGQPLAGQAAHGQAAGAGLLDVQGIQQGQHVAAQLLDAIGTFADQGLAVATGVVAQHLEVPSEGGDLRIPHVQVGAQGVGQHQHRRTGQAYSPSAARLPEAPPNCRHSRRGLSSARRWR